jgi:hypothetical protein
VTPFEDDLSLQHVQLFSTGITKMTDLALNCVLNMMLRWTVVIPPGYNQPVASKVFHASGRLLVERLMAIEEGLVLVRL